MSPFAIGTRRRRTRRLLVHALVLGGAIAFITVRFALQLDALRAMRASGPSWSFPSRVYADGLPFVEGRPLPLEYLRRHLEARGYLRSRMPLSVPGTYAVDGADVEIVTRGFDEVQDPEADLGAEHVRLTIANGRLLRVERLGVVPSAHAAAKPGALDPRRYVTFVPPPPRLEPLLVARLYDAQRVRRTWVPLSQIPEIVQRTVVASEDRRFYWHFGLDLRSNARALVANLRAGGVREGASTITQQLARGLFLGQQRTLGRKLSELGYAVGLELFLSKRQILEMYLNSVYWGRADGYGIAGIAEASRYYCGVPVESLTVADAALLAGLIPAPNSASPFRNRHAAELRRDAALRDMLASSVVDSATADRIRATPLPRRPGAMAPDRYPSFVSYVKTSVRGIPTAEVGRRGLAILTDMDVVWQQDAESGLAEGVARIERARGRIDQPLQGAFIALTPGDGAVRAVVGGRDQMMGDFDRATRARRQCGSAIKPLVYAAALDPTRRGPAFTPASTVSNLRRVFGHGASAWSPENSNGQYFASVTLGKALCQSLNVATANLVDSIGPVEVARYLDRFGLHGLKPVASIGLGSNEVTLVDLVNAYTTFPNRGVRHDPTPLRAVVATRGHVILRPSPSATRVMPEPTAALMVAMLENVVTNGISSPLRWAYGFTQPLGGKTGTTNDERDTWFVGFTPDVVAGVWLGYDTPQSLGRAAAGTALPVWAGVMRRAIAGWPPTPFESDSDLEFLWADAFNGLKATNQCPTVLRIGFVAGTGPQRWCDVDHSEDWMHVMLGRFSDSLAVWRGDSTAVDSGGE